MTIFFYFCTHGTCNPSGFKKLGNIGSIIIINIIIIIIIIIITIIRSSSIGSSM